MTLDTIKAGKYDWQRLGSIVMGVCFGLEAVAQMGDAVPLAARPVVAALHEWSAFVGVFVAAVLAKLGKPVVVTPAAAIRDRRDAVDGVEDTL